MSSPPVGNLQISQGYEVLPPKPGKAYPILCEEWDYLKTKVGRISSRPWAFHTIGSVLLGAALTTLISIVLGTFPDESKSRAIVIAWSVVAVTAICGIVCLLFAEQQRKVQQIQASDVLIQMDLIEKRYERLET